MSATATLRVDDSMLLRFADEVGPSDPIAVVGGRTAWSRGGEIDPSARLISAPSGVVDYRPEEMTIQVRAGTTVAELDAVLAERGQRSALPDRGGTVGGAVAVGDEHLDVLVRGLVRDAVLQVRYVSAEGRLVTGGGPVVKNVSGYNLPKLMTGSLGTLGLIGEVILRTNPVPDASIWLRCEIADAVAIHRRLLRPAAVLSDGVATWVHLEGVRGDVDAEWRSLREVTEVEEVDGPPELPPHRWSLSPAEAAHLSVESHGRFVASIGVGRVWADGAPTPRSDALAGSISSGDEAARMSVVNDIETRLKANFDPTGRLNPGRRP